MQSVDCLQVTGSTVNASYGRVAVSEYSNLFNQVSHTSDGAVGSVRDYYAEVSYGKLTVLTVPGQVNGPKLAFNAISTDTAVSTELGQIGRDGRQGSR